MTHYVAFRTTGNLLDLGSQLEQAMQTGNSSLQHELAKQLVLDFVDVIVERMAFDMMDQADLTTRQEKLFRNLAGFMRKTSKGMSGRVIKKMDDEELHSLLEYFQQRELELGNQVYFAFALEEGKAGIILSTFEAIESGNADNVKADYSAAIDELVDEIFSNLMDKPVQMLHMGKVMSKVIDVAFGSIRKGQHAAWHKAQPDLTRDDMERQVGFFKTLIVEA